jgi:Tol biopolymer transport system component
VRIGLGLSATLAFVALAATDALGRGATSATPARAESTVLLTASRFGKGAAENRPAKIVVANADGSGSRVLTTAWFSFVSPDGSLVAVVDSDVNWYTNPRLELYASTGGAPQRVVKAGCVHLYWSPDSTKLACAELSTTAGKPSRLLLIDAASGARTTLATGFFDRQISFSPDSTRLAYVQLPASGYLSSRSKLKVMDLTTHTITIAQSSAASSPVWGLDVIGFGRVKGWGGK